MYLRPEATERNWRRGTGTAQKDDANFSGISSEFRREHQHLLQFTNFQELQHSPKKMRISFGGGVQIQMLNLSSPANEKIPELAPSPTFANFVMKSVKCC